MVFSQTVSLKHYKFSIGINYQITNTYNIKLKTQSKSKKTKSRSREPIYDFQPFLGIFDWRKKSAESLRTEMETKLEELLNFPLKRS